MPPRNVSTPSASKQVVEFGPTIPSSSGSRSGADTSGVPPIVPTEDAGPAPIGVPPGYTATRGGPATGTRPPGIPVEDWRAPGVSQPPTFYDGSEVSFVFAMQTPDLVALQRQLAQAGLLDPDLVGGPPTDETLSAVRTIMTYANRRGFTSFTDALRDYLAQWSNTEASRSGGRGAAGGRLPAPVSNADDLRRVFKAAIIDTLGQGWDEARINALVADYQAHERAYNNAIAAGEAPDEQVASPETFALEAARQQDPTGAAAQDFLSVSNELLDMMGRWSS